MLATLRQPRYLGLFGLAVIIAGLCGLAGTWQVSRFEDKRAANHEYRANARMPVVGVRDALGPVDRPTGTGRAQKFRPVRATGIYLVNQQTLLRNQTVGNSEGFLLLTPLQTADGVLIVARGFIQAYTAADTSPANLPPPPAGPVTVTARLQPTSPAVDRFGQLPGVQVESINVAAQSQRIGLPVWPGFAELVAGQPGTTDLPAFDEPDLSNPAGGAEEAQHAAYVVQWYLFGVLALSSPFVLARAERRRIEEAAPPAASSARKASLDDRLAGRA